MVKLSETMKKALQAIDRHGGSTHRRRPGGYWVGNDQKLLRVDASDDIRGHAVGTNTIYALVDRGLLRKADDRKDYWAMWFLTEAAKNLLAHEHEPGTIDD